MFEIVNDGTDAGPWVSYKLTYEVGSGELKISMTRKSVHGTRMPPPIVFISPAIKHWVYNK